MGETYEHVEQQRNHFRREVTELSKQRDDLMEQAAFLMRQAAELLGRNRELTERLEAAAHVAQHLSLWRRRAATSRTWDRGEEVDLLGALLDKLTAAIAPTAPAKLVAGEGAT
jgi:hypothetical protein